MSVAAVIFFACEPAETPEQAQARAAAELDSARAEISARTDHYTQWLAAGNADSVATLVTDDYHALGPNEPVIAGKTQFLDYVRKGLASGRYTERFTSDSLEVSGPLAVQRGRFTLLFEPSTRGASAISDTGKFLWHWRKVDGHWRLAAAAWNSDLPVKR